MSDKSTTASNKADNSKEKSNKETAVKINEVKPGDPEEKKEKPKSKPCCGSCT